MGRARANMIEGCGLFGLVSQQCVLLGVAWPEGWLNIL